MRVRAGSIGPFVPFVASPPLVALPHENHSNGHIFSDFDTLDCPEDSNTSSGDSISPPASLVASKPEFPILKSIATVPLTTKKSERLLAKSGSSKEFIQQFCMWKDCSCATETILNFLEHIQTVHVAPQTKSEGYICLWEGCKVYNKKSCSLSWLERHVLSHGGNKPFRCIFPGCGLCFSAQGPLERHVNSHITTNINGTGANGHSSVARKLDSSPSKNARRKKNRGRKQKLNTGHMVDYIDKRTLEVIKYRLESAMELERESMHTCTFNCQVISKVLSKRVSAQKDEPHLLVHYHPEFIIPDEWVPESKFRMTKSVPWRQLPSDKIRVLFPSMFPPERKEKAPRKWKAPSSDIVDIVDIPIPIPTPAPPRQQEQQRQEGIVNRRKIQILLHPVVAKMPRPDGFTPFNKDRAKIQG